MWYFACLGIFSWRTICCVTLHPNIFDTLLYAYRVKSLLIFRERSYWSLVENPPRVLEISILQGKQSDRWHPDDVLTLKALSRIGINPDDVRRLKALSRIDNNHDALKCHSMFSPARAIGFMHVDSPRGLLEIWRLTSSRAIKIDKSVSCKNWQQFF